LAAGVEGEIRLTKLLTIKEERDFKGIYYVAAMIRQMLYG
jgi:hypothetical protein